VRTLIVDELRTAGAVVRLQRFEIEDPYGSGRLPLANIIGSFYPGEKRRFLLAAHYDTRPWADEDEDPDAHSQPILGANDGASGVAVLLEMAGILGSHRPKGLGVDLVFFDGEDYGRSGDTQHYLLGSKHFAANLGGYRPQGGILLDMVGARDARIGQEGTSLNHAPELTAKIFERAQRLGLDLFVAEPAEAIYDDHVPLLQAGIPVVDLIGWPYPFWHTLADTPDKCSQETLRSVGTLVADIVYDMP
jgi:Zn-dependent M28 family amino/carboxypeptidase